MPTIGQGGISIQRSGGGATPATITMDPDPLDLGTDPSATAELTANRLTGVRVELDGDIAAVASISTPLGWDGGGCGDGVGEVLEITVTRTGGTSGTPYSGEIVVTDDTGAETRFEVDLQVPASLLDVASAQGWDFIWAMDTAGTSQPNQGDGGVNALTLTRARATTTQMGALGRFPLATDTSDRASSAIDMGTGAGAIVVVLNLTSTAGPRAIYSGGGNTNYNKAWFLVDGGKVSLYKGPGPAFVVDMVSTISTGVWILAANFNGLGAVETWAKKVGSAREDHSGTRGASLTGTPQINRLGGDGAVYFSATGDYFFCCIRTGTEMTSAEFDALAAPLG